MPRFFTFDHLSPLAHWTHEHMNTPHVDTESLGFPTGYFSIKSVATGRLLDVYRNDTADDSPIALWPVKEQSLVESASVCPSIT